MANPATPTILQRGQQLIDDNSKPVPGLGILLVDTQTLVANNTTANVPIFSIIGSVQINALYGIVTTALGVNNTAASFRLNDQTSQIAITSVGGTTISAAPIGSLILKTGLAAATVTLKSSVAGALLEPTTLETVIPSPFIIVQKTAGVATNIEFNYTTTDTPTAGVINFFVAYIPLANGSYITAL